MKENIKKCNNCGREIISEKENQLCLECWWKELVEKTEITPENIRSFMEKYCFINLTFQKGEYLDLIEIEAKSEESLFSKSYYPVGLVRLENVSQYHPQTKRNMRKNFLGRRTYNECSAFLEKLFSYAQNENIKRVRKIEIDDNLKTIPVSLKIANIIIEKKTTEEIEKEKL
jgi:hypothetical protein